MVALQGLARRLKYTARPRPRLARAFVEDRAAAPSTEIGGTIDPMRLKIPIKHTESVRETTHRLLGHGTLNGFGLPGGNTN